MTDTIQRQLAVPETDSRARQQMHAIKVNRPADAAVGQLLNVCGRLHVRRQEHQNTIGLRHKLQQ